MQYLQRKMPILKMAKKKKLPSKKDPHLRTEIIP